MRGIVTASTAQEYKVRIVQDAANALNNNDSWANDNYQIINANGLSRNFLTSGAFGDYGFPFTGKLWGATFDATRTGTGNADSNIRVTINGTQVHAGTGLGWYQGFGSTANDILNLASQLNNNIVPITYTTPNGSVTVPSNQINDLWASYVETQVNHHWGKCRATNGTGGAVGDDYVGLAECAWNTFQPHSFNSGEGRILQWFIK